MKQKMVLKVQMNCEKCRTQALRIAAASQGVTSVAIQRQEKDELMVVGDGVDSVKLTRCLRKKLHYATILTIEEIKDEKKEEKKEKKKEEKKEEKKDDEKYTSPYYVCYPSYPMPPQIMVQDPCQCQACSIL
ncbi:heavy metal-associated isoprenylated plant protein 47 isoform X3 [Gossypium raimondii]|uniref:heavy metal-associated isoprenylated plant protein 47 isoform X3 n=1 Tax=Gossypium raimondii TaxID=29730 RepID=UPI00063A8EBC|nr:heavy metal-associated isoprenylated plant protein 47 isoform X3 [Gossypium raimondii]